MTAPLVAKTPYDVDVVAAEIARAASLAKSMPPSWDGAKIAHPFTGTQGENLGRVLPGRGVALASDLKSLGITKPIPYVYEKTLAMKAIEAFGGRERLAVGAASILLGAKLGALGMADALLSLPVIAGAITNYDGIINARANGKFQDVVQYASSQTSVATQWHSGLRSGTKQPAGTFAPAAIPGGTATSRATTGVLFPHLSNPTGTDKKYLVTVGYASGSTLNMVLFYDLLIAASNINANVNTAQTVNTTALTRYTTGAGVMATMEVTTALGATASNVTMGYTDQDNTSGLTTPSTAMVTSAIVGRLQPAVTGPFMQLAAGDYGVRSVQSITFSAAMGAGVLNLYLYYPMAFLPGVAANIYIERDSTVQIDGLSEIVKGSDNEVGALGYFVLPNATASGNNTMFLRTVMG
ncbi:MAG: hypothetical protein ACK5VI_10835 [Opitutia bacterium]